MRIAFKRTVRSPLLVVAVAASLLAVMGMVITATPATAKTPTPPKYAGAAPGSVTCSLFAKVSFSPPLTKSGGGTDPSAVKGTLSGCSSTNSAVTITKGKVIGSFASSPLSCATTSTTGASASLTIAWKGSVNGVVGGITYAGKATFTATTVIAGSATGSFSGGATTRVTAPSNLATLCDAKKGIKKLALTGTFTTAASPTLANWPQNHYGPDGTGFQPNETTIGVSNVGSLSQKWRYPTSSPGGQAPLIENGVLYTTVVTANGEPTYLEAFDASGKSCSGTPVTCAPLWTSTVFTNFRGMTIADGEVFIMTYNYGLLAFDAAGNNGCTGSPKVCAPIWEGSPAFLGEGTPVVANGLVYIAGVGNGSPLNTGGAFVAAFDVSGTNCPVIGAVKTCAPLWTTTGGTGTQSGSAPAVSNGVLFINSQGATPFLQAFDATGSGNSCSGTPKVCAPLWTGALTGGWDYSAPAVADGTVYVGGGVLTAFDANGTKNCSVSGGVKTCTPIWTAPSGGSNGVPAAANGVVYTVGGGGILSAFDAAGGSSSCTGPVTSKTCTPLWVSPGGRGGYVTSSSPAVANGVVYFTSDDGAIYAYDAAGSVDCSVSNSIKTCNPLWSAATWFGSPSVANGVVYVGQGGSVYIYAYSL